MTVQKLISELKKMPQRAIVGWQDHDHASDELNAVVNSVWEVDHALKISHNVGVVLRPVKR